MPTIQIEARAIRLTADLIGERGQWLIVHQDDRVQVLSAADALAAYGLRGTKSPSPSTEMPAKGRGAPVVPKRSYKLTVEGKTIRVAGQAARILGALSQAVGAGNQPVITRRVTDFATETDARQTSGRLTDLHKLGLVKQITTPGKPRTFALTNNGLAVVRQELPGQQKGAGE
jgi:hypothetical protein